MRTSRRTSSLFKKECLLFSLLEQSLVVHSSTPLTMLQAFVTLTTLVGSNLLLRRLLSIFMKLIKKTARRPTDMIKMDVLSQDHFQKKKKQSLLAPEIKSVIILFSHTSISSVLLMSYVIDNNQQHSSFKKKNTCYQLSFYSL